MIYSVKTSIAGKLFLFLFLFLLVTIIPLFYVANNALREFGAYTNATNTHQIRKMTDAYLSAMTREQARKFDEIFTRIKTSAVFLANAAAQVYSHPERYAAVENPFPHMICSPKNSIFFTPETDPVVTAFWGDDKVPPGIQRELDALSSLDPFLKNTKKLTDESLAVHIIALSGIGKYYTEDPTAKQTCYDLPPPQEFDMRDGEPVTVFTRQAFPDFSARWTRLYQDDATANLMMTATAPVVDDDGTLRGIAGIDLPLNRITRDLLTNGFHNKQQQGTTFFAFFMGTQSELIAFPSEYLPLLGLEVDTTEFKYSSHILNYRLTDSHIPAVRQAALRLIQGTDRLLKLDLHRETYILASEQLVETGWHIVLVSREKELLSSVHQTREALDKSLTAVSKNFIFYAVLIVLVSLTLMLFTVRIIVRPIRQLTQLTRKVAQKDYSEFSPVKRRDELGELSDAFNRMIQQLLVSEKREKAHAASLAKRSLQLKQLNEHLVLTEETQRKTIASDLHDSIAQTLAMGISKIKNVIESGNNPRPGDLDEIQGFLEKSVREIRSLIYQLSPPILDDFDIDIAIGFLVEETNEQHGAEFTYVNNLTESVRINHALKVTLYRAVNELLTNILKHAGTLSAEIELSHLGGNLIIRVEDQGDGMDVNNASNMQGSGFGLYSLSERMGNFGGGLEIESTLGSGTRIILTAPVSTKEETHEKNKNYYRG